MTTTRKHLKRSAIAAAILCSTAFGLATAAQATTTFLYTGALQTYTITTTGIYDVTLAGGQGGSNYGGGGGAGAFVGGDVSLTAGTVLNIVVGGQGINGYNYPGAWASSGGGGSFLFTSGGLLAVAGGGGGADLSYNNGQPGTVAAPGSGNGGASNLWDAGGGGAGWLGDGTSYGGGFSGGGGSSYPTFAGGLAATNYYGYTGPAGAYGGGGAGGWDFGGGGGGYTGGDASYADGNGGWGGTSYLAPSFANVTATAGANFGDGYITLTAVPETSTWLMMLTGFAALGFAGYRRGKAATTAA